MAINVAEDVATAFAEVVVKRKTQIRTNRSIAYVAHAYRQGGFP